ncbi:unnamed protein product [Leptosia nina]|uniref:U1-type domain-containing protein n=1 Tax=Leptosia nina TaxID=320188 RepID=A0AAV1JUG0_9NEOP
MRDTVAVRRLCSIPKLASVACSLSWKLEKTLPLIREKKIKFKEIMAINKYFFTMDEIDLIPNKFGNFNDVVPLWSCGKDTQKYFEFEIRGSEEKSCAGIQTTSCYICDIEVPKMFLIEHRNSRKHLINKSVADTALSRISKDSIDDFSVVKNIDNTNNYFCPECVAVVNVEERHSHENQQSHKHSVLYNNMMEHFHSVYINEVDTSNSKFDSSICSESNNNTRHCEEILTSKSGVFPESSSPDGEIEYELERPSRSTGVVFCMEDDLIHCTVCNTKFDIHSYNVHKTGKRHIMNKVSNVHYMMREFGDDLQCITCKVTVENSFESVSAHCNGADHLASYCKALKENSVINRKGRLYCKICAKNIHKRNELIHIYQSFHQENYANYKQVDDKNDMTTDSGNKVVYICPICDVKVPNNIDNIKIHNDGRPHKSNLLFRDQKTDSQMEYIGDSAISDIDLQEQDKKSSMEDNDIIVKKKRTRGRRNKKNITKALPNDLTSCTTNSSKTALIEVGDSVVETSIPETEVTLNVKSSILTPELLNYEDTQKVYDVHPKLSTATLESANSIQEPLIQSSGSKIVIPEYLNVKKELLTPISQFSNQVPLNPSAESLNLSSELIQPLKLRTQ